MRHEDEGRTRFQSAHACEEDVDLGPLEDRGWFVEQDDQMVAGILLQRQRLGEFDHLP